MTALELAASARRAYDTSGRWKRFLERRDLCRVDFGLQESIKVWRHRASWLLDESNWCLDRLSAANGARRKPKACLDVRMTSRGNLCLEWYPGHSFIGRHSAERDFERWMDIQGYNAPLNRIIFIRGFMELVLAAYNRTGKPYFQAEQLLIEAVHAHLEETIQAIGEVIDLRMLGRLQLEYAGRKQRRLRKVDLVEHYGDED